MARCVFCGKQCRFYIIPKNSGIEDRYPAHKKCDREFKSSIKPKPQRLYVEGNNGGDYIEIYDLGNGIVDLQVGHCCVNYINQIVPVEFITTTLAKIVEDREIIDVIKAIGLDAEYTLSLIEKLR